MVTMQKERDRIRSLAGRIAALAAHPREAQKIAAWQKLNDLEPERPLLWITEIPWGEILDKHPELTLQCRNPKLRRLETGFLRTLFVARHLPCDQVIEGVYWVQKQITGYDRDFGLPVQDRQLAHEGGSHIRSHHYQPIIREPEDIDKIKMPEVAYDEAATLAEKDFCARLFGDLLEVRLSGVRGCGFNPWDKIVRWTGVNEALIDLIARPDYLHAIMRRLTDSMLARIDQLETQNLLDLSNPRERIGSGGAGYTTQLPQPDFDPAQVRPIDQWGSATAQIFGQVSPEMHDEFALRYEIEVLSRYGLNYYGCCEPLHNKMHLMAKIPRLRKVSISPWCEVAKAAEQARDRYVFSHKPSPAVFASEGFDGDRAERDMRERLEQSGGMPCEFIMKDISTIRGDVARLIEWCARAWRIVAG